MARKITEKCRIYVNAIFSTFGGRDSLELYAAPVHTRLYLLCYSAHGHSAQMCRLVTKSELDDTFIACGARHMMVSTTRLAVSISIPLTRSREEGHDPDLPPASDVSISRTIAVSSANCGFPADFYQIDVWKRQLHRTWQNHGFYLVFWVLLFHNRTIWQWV